MNVHPHKVNLSEEDIENWLWENPNEVRTFIGPVKEWIGRQIRLPSGIADLIGYVEFESDKIIEKLVTVIEVKNVEVTSAALTQVCRYSKDIQALIQQLYIKKLDYDYVCSLEEEPMVIKIIVAKGEISDQLLYEANALDVSLISFEVEYNLNLSGTWKWNNKHRDEVDRQLSVLIKSGIFDLALPTFKDVVSSKTENIIEEHNG